jgi:hypothetical protein
MNHSGLSHFNQARIEWAIRLKYSPMPALDMDILATQLNAFRIGDLRQIGKTWEVMMERDGELAVNSDKRKSEASSLEWQIVSDGSSDGDRQAAALQYFYENLTATEALEQDVTGGVNELIYQVMSALDYRYSVHEMLVRVDNAAAREVTAEFRHTPVHGMPARLSRLHAAHLRCVRAAVPARRMADRGKYGLDAAAFDGLRDEDVSPARLAAVLHPLWQRIFGWGHGCARGFAGMESGAGRVESIGERRSGAAQLRR